MRTLFSARALFILSGLFIFYATTIPWDLVHAPSLDRVAWIPLWDPERGRPPSIPDLVQNVVLFMPFGFFGALSIAGVRKRGAIARTIVMGALGFALSLVVELLQTMSESRTPSASDIVTNTGGAGIGAIIAFVYEVHLAERMDARLDRTLRAQPGLLVFLAYLAIILAGSLAPFIPTLDVSSVKENVRSLLDDPWGPKTIGALAGDFVLFVALAFLAAYEVPHLLARRRMFPTENGLPKRVHAAVFGALSISALAVAIEFLQLFIVGHSPGMKDAVVGAFGALCGAVLVMTVERGPLAPAEELGALTKRKPWLVIAFAVLAPAVRALQPFELVPLSEKLADFSAWQFVPFWALFRNLNLATFRNVFEAAFYYVPLGYALFAIGRSPRTAFAAAFVLAEVLEVLQLPIAGRTFDVTEGLWAGGCALLGAFVLSRLRERSAPRVRDDTLPPNRPAIGFAHAPR